MHARRDDSPVRFDRSTTLHTVLGVLFFASLAALSGCWRAGGTGFSLDSYTYISRTWQPETIIVIDTRTGQAVWSKDVPVNKKLVMKFYPNADTGIPAFPDKLMWDLWPADQEWGDPSQVAFVPDSWARRVDVKLRAAPEMPPVEPGEQPIESQLAPPNQQ